MTVLKGSSMSMTFGGQPTGTPAPAAAGDLIKDSNTQAFMKDVIEASRQQPVIVDFWAPWCGPCKQLGPALEKVVRAAGGKVRMVKINVDENQRIAAQLRIQSIPTVYAFWQGQPVDGFQGALPASELKTFIDRVRALAGDGGLADAVPAQPGLGWQQGPVLVGADLPCAIVTGIAGMGDSAALGRIGGRAIACWASGQDRWALAWSPSATRAMTGLRLS